MDAMWTFEDDYIDEVMIQDVSHSDLQDPIILSQAAGPSGSQILSSSSLSHTLTNVS